MNIKQPILMEHIRNHSIYIIFGYDDEYSLRGVCIKGVKIGDYSFANFNEDMNKENFKIYNEEVKISNGDLCS